MTAENVADKWFNFAEPNISKESDTENEVGDHKIGWFQYCPQCKVKRQTTCCACGCGSCCTCNYRFSCIPMFSDASYKPISSFTEPLYIKVPPPSHDNVFQLPVGNTNYSINRELKVKKTHPEAKLPTKTNDTDFGYDLYALHDYQIFPHYEGQGVVKVDTGVAFEFPVGYGGIIFDRSGMGYKGYKTFGCVVDNSYRGSICILLAKLVTGNDFKLDDEPYLIKKGDRVAQLIIQKVEQFNLVEVDTLSSTDRGEKGFGSSGT